MLMFGNEYDIVRHFPKYFLDYREEMDSAKMCIRDREYTE